MSTIESEGFKVTKDFFGGLVLKTKDQTFDSAEEYDAKLKVALPKWESSGVRGFWAEIPLNQAGLTAVFAKYGLDFNHAQPGYVMMSKWLSIKQEPSMIPEYANQYLGVAGFVINNTNQLLVIKEKFHPMQKTAPWKLPGGHAFKGEEISDTARREVWEETGIKADFIGIVTFRHQTHFRHGCSDFYFICLMRPSDDDQTIRKCDQEISDCKWMDLDEYINDPDVTEANRHFAQCYKDGVVGGNMIISANPVSSYNGKKIHQVYSIHALKKSENS